MKTLRLQSIFFSMWLVLSLFGQTVQAEPQHSATSNEQDETTFNDLTESLPAVAFRFTFTVENRGSTTQAEHEDWYLWREATQIETRSGSGETSEIWRRDWEGFISYQRVSHTDQQVIDYTPDDLSSLQLSPDWAHLTSIISHDFITLNLDDGGQVETLGKQARRYQGTVNGVEIEVWWLEAEQIPALFRQTSGAQVTTLRLQEVYPLEQSPWLRARADQYAHVNFDELTDQESDPFARRLQSQVASPYLR